MKTARLGVCAVVLAAAVGCSSESGTPGQAFDQNLEVEPGGEAPSFRAADVAYPKGPYGTKVGNVIANLEFMGWRDPVKAGYKPAGFQKISLSEYYDPDGSKGIKLIIFNSSAVWCGVCKEEFRQMRDNPYYAGTESPTPSKYEEYGPQGVQFLMALFEDIDSEPAKPKDLQTWGNVYEVTGGMFLDPGFKTGRYFDSDATPVNLVIDPRNMEIIDKAMGYDYRPEQTFWKSIDEHLAKRQ